jgi:hypothetical protein
MRFGVNLFGVRVYFSLVELLICFIVFLVLFFVFYLRFNTVDLTTASGVNWLNSKYPYLDCRLKYNPNEFSY